MRCHHLSPLPLNAVAESQKFAGAMNRSNDQTRVDASDLTLFLTYTSRHCWHDVTFCDCRLAGGVGSIVGHSMYGCKNVCKIIHGFDVHYPKQMRFRARGPAPKSH